MVVEPDLADLLEDLVEIVDLAEVKVEMVEVDFWVVREEVMVEVEVVVAEEGGLEVADWEDRVGLVGTKGLVDLTEEEVI